MTDHSNHADPFDPQRREILAAALMEAAFDGWTTQTMRAAMRSTGFEGEVDGELARLFPRGIADLLDFWADEEDQAMASAFAALDEPPTRIRDKITWLVRNRIERMTVDREAARRAAATMALPVHAGLGPKLAWRSAGAMWVALGDQSLDGNFYSKRATLTGVYLSTLTRWFADDTEHDEAPFSETWAFLDKRIENVMQIEKLKGSWRKNMPSPEAIIGDLAKLRYGGR